MRRRGYFLDTFAMMEYAAGNPRYKRYFESKPMFTSLMNLTELYYHALGDGGEDAAQRLYLGFRGYSVDLQEADVFSGMKFRVRMKASGKEVSYVDALGYAMAERLGVPFLTGDTAFKEIRNVEFVR